MPVINFVPGFNIQTGEKILEQFVLELNRMSTPPADQVMVLMVRHLVDQLSTADMGREENALCSEKIEGPVYGGLSHPRKPLLDMLENLQWGEMAAHILESLEHGQTLRGDSKTPGPKGMQDIFGCSVHKFEEFLIASTYNKEFYQNQQRLQD